MKKKNDEITIKGWVMDDEHLNPFLMAVERAQLDAELQKGVDSIQAGKVYSADEVDVVLAKGFDI